MKLKQILIGALLIGAGYGFYWLRTNVSPEMATLVLGYILGIITCVVLYALARQDLLGAIGHLKGVLGPSIKEQMLRRRLQALPHHHQPPIHQRHR